jgi:hypothetical protein
MRSQGVRVYDARVSILSPGGKVADEIGRTELHSIGRGKDGYSSLVLIGKY